MIHSLEIVLHHFSSPERGHRLSVLVPVEALRSLFVLHILVGDHFHVAIPPHNYPPLVLALLLSCFLLALIVVQFLLMLVDLPIDPTVLDHAQQSLLRGNRLFHEAFDPLHLCGPNIVAELID